MTTPEERTRNLVQTGAFLKELRADGAVPEHIRREANRLLRHYPTISDFQLLAQIEAHSQVGLCLLTPQIDTDWFEDYRFGAHT